MAQLGPEQEGRVCRVNLNKTLSSVDTRNTNNKVYCLSHKITNCMRVGILLNLVVHR